MLLRLFLLLLLAPSIGVGCAHDPGAAYAVDAERERQRDAERLRALWLERAHDDAESGLPVGPGDVIEVVVPGLPELEDHTARVASDGTLALPLVGPVPAAGRTEDELSHEIRRRLEAGIMYNPPLALFVREYRSRQVGVLGAVDQPGLFPLSGEHQTILDLIAVAGGLTDEADSKIQFVPEQDDRQTPTSASEPRDVLGRQVRDSIRIDLDDIEQGNHLIHKLHLRPGDIILVPDRGEVLLDGWVRKPGAYPISPQLTLLGALASAGGPRFAANTGSLRVYRQAEDGRQISYKADLGKIESGRAPDLVVEAGDVIDVPGRPARMMVTGIYVFLTSIFNIGFAVF